MPDPQYAPAGPSLSAAPGLSAIVGIGGSAGALDGYERFFLSLPADSGMAFVVVPHLDPDHRGLMPDILARCTGMPVLQIEDGMAAQPNTVYVIAPGHSLSIMNGVLLLEDLEAAQGRVIDTFFEALAADQGESAVAVVLSGMGTDGTQGLQAIKEHFGLVLVQDPQSAEYPSMPASAAGTQLADDVLPAEELAPSLYMRVTRRQTLRVEDLVQDGQAGVPLQKILRLVRVKTGHDFSNYKRSTLIRRIDRRMRNHRLDNVAQYMRFLQDVPQEIDALFQDFTINVTSFFRDAEAFADLKENLRTSVLTQKQDMDTVRVWVVGCATGEEAYSVAIVLHELMDELKTERVFKVQVFASDIDPQAIEKARYGLYPPEIAYVVSPERLAFAFEEKDGGYQVRSAIRESVIFALHNTFGDPPFTRLDLLCCRNMLIYLKVELQRQIMNIFHYALRPGGLLFLGASETAGSDRDLFRPLNLRWKIYVRGEGAALPLLLGQGVSPSTPPVPHTVPESKVVPGGRAGSVPHLAQSLLLAHHAPPAVVINEGGDIQYVHGSTARYLELPAGTVMTNVFDMAREGLRYELPALVRQALAEHREVVRRVSTEVDGAPCEIDVTVRLLPARAQRLLLIEFQERATGRLDPPPAEHADQILTLQRELQYNKETLQSTVEEMAVSMEELKSTNEELQTTNEELQSTNEELTTSKEELQSLNEELTTINAEHQRVIFESMQANDDLKNILDSAGIATVFLDNALRVKRFTPRISRVINLMPVDLGRPLSDLNVNLFYEHLTADIVRVLDTLEVFETQVRTRDEHWYLMRISPYRTSDNFIDGVVVAFTNIDRIKALEQQARDTSAYAGRVLDSIHDPVLVLDARLRVVTANRALYTLLRSSPAQVRGERLHHLGNFMLDEPELLQRLHEVLAGGEAVVGQVLTLHAPHLGPRQFKIEVDPVPGEDETSVMVVLKLEDVTELMRRAAAEGPDWTGDAGPPPEQD
ncbi:CheR family methyltransferase [Deinococcus aquaedulcis]|uniref:CheR family methyltransferase n=1 Tax=Deinococcus aquaedulcis TaxID=2840455 RepID=UPI001C833BE6|nr:CheR family methyltransferase [Deinococcus aquaedulcis]